MVEYEPVDGVNLGDIRFDVDTRHLQPERMPESEGDHVYRNVEIRGYSGP